MPSKKEHPLYSVWHNMINRCSQPKRRDYSRYGGRGIRVCERWRGSFEAFASDVPPRPSANHQFDRVDNDGHYEPGNVRWATATEQARNRRRTQSITLDGVTRTVPEWAAIVGIRQDTLYQRLAKGWSDQKTLTTPLDRMQSAKACRRRAA